MERPVSQRTRILINIILIVVMILTLGVNTFVNYRWGCESLNIDTNENVSNFELWLNQKAEVIELMSISFGGKPQLVEAARAKQGNPMFDAIKMDNTVTDIYIANADFPEKIIYHNEHEALDKDFSLKDCDWYTGAIDAGGQIYLSEPFDNKYTGTTCITMSKMVTTPPNGDFICVAAVDFEVNSIADFFAFSAAGSGGYAVLVSPTQTICYHPNPEYMLKDGQLTNVYDTECGSILDSETPSKLYDYDHSFMIALAKEGMYGYSVITVESILYVFRNIFIFDFLIFLLILFALIRINRRITILFKWQEDTRAQLEASYQEALENGKQKTDFLALMSHEIRTPINVILGMNEMILRESEKDSINKYANDIKTAGNTLLTLINGILDFSKLEQKKTEIIPVVYKTTELVSYLDSMIRSKAEEKNLEFIMDVDESIPTALLGDDIRIKQIIINLLTNAVKYTEKGSVKCVLTGVNDGFSYYLHVEVIDTGIGIKPEDKSKLFDSFARINDEKTRAIEGSGLGISIVEGLLNLMNSNLEIESEYGKGSNFSFTVKQEISDSTPIGKLDHKRVSEPQNLSVEFETYPNAKVLVVDDNKINLMVSEALMKRNEVQVDKAISGKMCIEMALKKEYDIIFLDHMMPEMDGIDTLVALRANENFSKKTKIVILTANALEGARQKYIDRGFDDYLSKPIDPALLEEIFKKFL